MHSGKEMAEAGDIGQEHYEGHFREEHTEVRSVVYTQTNICRSELSGVWMEG